MSDHPLHSAICRDANLTPDQLAAVSAAFTEIGHEPLTLADRLKSLGVITQYQFRKIQIGRSSELLFGKFFICERIGEGGMGKVYRALSPDGVEVALKTIRPNLMANKTVVERYKREARAAASLEHPNIVKLIEADDADGRYYIAMEFVNGCDLSRLTKDLLKESRTIHPSEAAEYIRQAALGLQHSHDRNLIHRDIKPSNLLVCGERALPNTGGKAVLKILDMGLVRSLAEEDEGATELTRDGTVVGTPDYMSPEQAKNSSNVDHRADIYSLGCTLYFLLKGGAPYPDGTAIDKLIRHQLDPVPDIRQFRADVSPGLSGVIRKMMSKKPADRFQSCNEVARELALYTEEGTTFDFGSFAATPSYDLVDLNPRNDRMPAVSQSPASIKTQQQTGTITKRKVLKAVHEVKHSAKTDPTTETPHRTDRKKLPKPITKPQPDPNPSGDVAGSAATSKASQNSAESIPAKPKRAATIITTPVTAISKRIGKPNASVSWQIIMGAVIVVIAMSGLVVLAVLMANGKPKRSTIVTQPTTHTALPSSHDGGTILVKHLIPDNTAAVLVVNPKPYLNKLQFEIITGQQLKDYAIIYLTKINPLLFDQISLAFKSDAKRCLLIGNYDTLLNREVIRRDLIDITRLKLITEADGTHRLRDEFDISKIRIDTRVKLFEKPPAYFICTPSVGLLYYSDNLLNRKYGAKNPRLGLAIFDSRSLNNVNYSDSHLADFVDTGDLHFHPKARKQPDFLARSRHRITDILFILHSNNHLCECHSLL